jgi:hypothetical protein
MTRNSPIASWLKRIFESPSAASVKSTPLTRIVDWEALPPPPTTGPPPMKRKPPRSRETPGAMKARRWKSRSGTGSDSICSGTMLVELSVL